MKYLVFIFFILSLLYCEKPTSCYTCYSRSYYIDNDTIRMLNKTSFSICNATQDEIDIFESMNNTIQPNGTGTSVECFIKTE